jgi:Ulp1 family protease
LFQEREISLTFTNVIKKYLNDEADHFKMDFNCDNFSVFNMDDYSGPKQQDGYNCGVYTMMLMDFISHGYDYRLVEHSRMSHFRSYIAISLKQGTKNIN